MKQEILTVQTDDRENFQECMNAYLAEGYRVSSTSCTYGWYAILIKDEAN